MFADRRSFLKGLAGSSLSLMGTPGSRLFAQNMPSLPAPQDSGIDHIVLVTMENRSFDHFFGWLPNANGRQAGLSYTDNSGATHSTYWLAPDYTGCGHSDPDHSYGPGRVAYDNGAMDGFLRAAGNDVYTIGYYVESDIPFYAALAQAYMACDNWFAAILGPTFPNRMFIWAAQTDRLGDSISLSSLPTIFDRLSAKGISHRYYFNNIPYLAMWGVKYISSTALFSRFLSDAASGNLPAVSFVDPNYTVLDDGTGNDDHPHADIRNGDAFLSKVFNALANGPKWANTVLIVTFDEWGGFFDHVAPPRVIAPNKVDPDLVNGEALLGFRLPTVIASPFTFGAGVNSFLYDHTATLKLIEWRWDLQALTARDASTAIFNPASSFNFSSPVAQVPSLPQVNPVFAAPCLESGIFGFAEPAPAGKPNGFTALAKSQLVRDWMSNPRFQSVKLP
jgi:phospholipase C